MMKKLIICICVVGVLSTVALFAQKGSISGVITDASTGEPLIGATVMLEGTTTGNITDIDGKYVLANLAPGNYTVLVSFISYQTQKLPDVEVKDGHTTVLNTKLKEAVTELEEVQIVARASRESEPLLLLEQKESDLIKESIGATRLSAMGVSDAASATTKITGVTKSEGTGDVFIRGLGDRYLSTTMNGLPIPSDDIEKKNINLKLFSTDVISSVGINKTYEASSYGDQASGNVDIQSKRTARNNSIEISTGVNTNVFAYNQFGNFKATQNLNDVLFGFYSQPYETKEAITKQSWNTKSRKLPLDFGISFIGGKDFSFKNKQKLFVFATASYSGDSEYREGAYKKYRANTLDKRFSLTEDYITSYNANALLNLHYVLSPGNSISYNSLFVNKLSDELYEAGRNLNSYVFEQIPKQTENFVRDQNTKQTSLLINQLLGEHRLGSNNKLKWAASYDLVNADEPNRIRNEVAVYPESSVALLTSTGGYQQKKSFQNIADREINGFIKDEYIVFHQGNRKVQLNLGVNSRYKTRDFTARPFSAYPQDSVAFSSIDNMDEIFMNETLFDTGSLEVNDVLPSDTYSASLFSVAGYASAFFSVSKVSGRIGVRYEEDYMDIDWNVTNYVGRKGTKSPEYKNVLPSLNLKYGITENNNVRFAFSKTITIPEFKEISPFEYVAPTGDVFKGNEDLKNSTNYNFDLKWEMFPSAKELFSVATFYKKIKDPINLALTRGSSGFFKYENTSNEANVYGLEFEARLGLIKPEGTGSPELSVILNATKMWHSQDLLPNYQYGGKTESSLQGASDFIANASLTFSTNSDKALAATVTGNYSSDKIFALGSPESVASSDVLYNDEIIEEGFVTLDFTLSKQFTERITLKLKGKNLLNPEIKRTQHIKELNSNDEFDATVRSYRKGIQLSIALSMNLNK